MQYAILSKNIGQSHTIDIINHFEVLTENTIDDAAIKLSIITKIFIHVIYEYNKNSAGNSENTFLSHMR